MMLSRSNSTMSSSTNTSTIAGPGAGPSRPRKGADHIPSLTLPELSPVPLNDLEAVDRMLMRCDEAELEGVVDRERRRWEAIPEELFARPVSSGPSSPGKRNRIRSTASFLHLGHTSARSLQEYDTLYADHSGPARNRPIDHTRSLSRIHVGPNIVRQTEDAWRLIAKHKRLPNTDQEMHHWIMEDDRRTARKNRSRTALGGYKRHDIRGIKRTLTEGEGSSGLKLNLPEGPAGLSLGGSGMASSASATFTFSSTSTSTSTGTGSGSLGGSAAVAKQMRDEGTSRYFTSNEAGPSTSTPNTKEAQEIDPDRTPTAVKLVSAPVPVPVPASSQQSATSQRSSASQRKRPTNSQTNRLGFVATKPSSQDIVIDNGKPLEPAQPPMKKKKNSWNNARTSLLAEKRRRLSDHQKEEEAKRASAEGSGSGVPNTIRTEEVRSARPTWAVVNKSPASSETEDESDDEGGAGMASMAVVKQRMGKPRLLEEAFRRTKAVAVQEMEVDELGSSSLPSVAPPPRKGQIAAMQEEYDELASSLNLPLPSNTVEISFEDILTSTPRKAQPVRHQSSPASKSFHQMSQEAEPEDETDEDVDMDLQNMLDAPSAHRRHLFNPPDYDTPPASQTQLRSGGNGVSRTTSWATNEMGSPRSSQRMSTQRVNVMVGKRGQEAVDLLLGDLQNQF